MRIDVGSDNGQVDPSRRALWRRRWLPAVLLLACIGLVYGGMALFEYRSDRIVGDSTQASQVWEQIRSGMTLSEVERLAGEPSATHGRYRTWGEGWIFDASAVYRVCFDDGRVASKDVAVSSD